ncbi:MAG: hypothetical protein LBR05_01400 [Azoarcus sp.]|nr:hypothetical protein [Azoarcus sp.]
MRSLNLFLATAACLFFFGCNTTIPLDRATIFYDRNTYVKQIQRDIGPIDEPILQHGRCTLHLAAPGANVTTNYRFCTYALSAERLYIQQWDAAKLLYSNFVTFEFSRFTSVDLASFGRTRQIKMTEPQRVAGFSAVVDEGAWIDGKATEAAFQIIKAQGIGSAGDGKLLGIPPAPAPVVIPVIVR